MHYRIGYNTPNNAFRSNQVTANEDGSVLERLENLERTLALRTAVKTDGAILAALDPIFTITGGSVRARISGFVDTVIVGNTNLRLQHTTLIPAATINLNAGAVACNDDAAGTYYYNIGTTGVFTPTATLGYAIMDPVTLDETYYLLSPGSVGCLGSAARTGNIVWSITYEKLTPTSLVVAAA